MFIKKKFNHSPHPLRLPFFAGCDQERNQLIRGFFHTATPVPPTATITPIPTETPIPEPTPQSLSRIDDADYYLLIGDYDNAMSAYRAIIDQQPDDAYRAAAALGIARIHAQRSDYEGCQNALIGCFEFHTKILN